MIDIKKHIKGAQALAYLDVAERVIRRAKTLVDDYDYEKLENCRVEVNRIKRKFKQYLWVHNADV